MTGRNKPPNPLLKQHNEMSREANRLDTILFCATFSPESKGAFSIALDTAGQHGARLIILHIIEPRHRYSGILMTEEGDVILTDDVIKKFSSKLSNFYLSDLDKTPPCHIDLIISGGIPWMEILRVARKEKVDHIIMGCSGAEATGNGKGETKAPRGETAQRVSSKAACTVSVVPEYAQAP